MNKKVKDYHQKRLFSK